MRILVLIIFLFSKTSISAEEESVEWTLINGTLNAAAVEVSRYDVDEVSWPIVYLWARITFPSPDKDGDYGEIQEWWLNCEKIKGGTITYRTYKTKNMNLGNWSSLGHFNKNVERTMINEICKLYEVK